MSESSTPQRRYRRVTARVPLRISTIEPERDRWTGRPFFRATREESANLSRGGVFVRTREPLAPGRRVLLEISLPNGKPLEAIGRVAWSKRVVTSGEQSADSGVGIEFLGGAPQHFEDLEQWLDQSQPPAEAPPSDERA